MLGFTVDSLLPVGCWRNDNENFIFFSYLNNCLSSIQKKKNLNDERRKILIKIPVEHGLYPFDFACKKLPTLSLKIEFGVYLPDQRLGTMVLNWNAHHKKGD